LIFKYFSSTVLNIFHQFWPAFRLTFRLFAKLPAHYEANRRFAWAGNLGEGGVGTK